MDIREILRHLQRTGSDRAVARSTGVDRKTVARYRVWAAEQGLLNGSLPPMGELERLLEETLNSPPPPQNVSSVEPFREAVLNLRQQGIEMAAIHARLRERGYTGSYSSVVRFVRRLEPPEPDVVVRVETKPGEEAQADFGYAGKMIDPEDGRLRKAWSFVMTLSWSRHQYVEFVFDQRIETWLSLHRNAFAFFGGVPQRVVLDNLKAGIARSCWEEPQAQHAYRECAEHYGFLIAPCRPGTPEHKGKVEQGGVHYVTRNFLAGRGVTTNTQSNQDVLGWIRDTAGVRVHGTTRERPLDRFAIEQGRLQPLPATPYDLANWKRVRLHRDGHVVFDGAYYSAPFRLVGQYLWVRGGARQVQLFTSQYQLVATHSRAHGPGQRMTNLSHVPTHKVPGLTLNRAECRDRAARIGPATLQVVEQLLEHRPEDRLRAVGRVLRLVDRFSPPRLEAACARALRFDDVSYSTIKRILEQNLEAEQLPLVPAPVRATVFVRSASELLGPLAGGELWN